METLVGHTRAEATLCFNLESKVLIAICSKIRKALELYDFD